MSKLSSLAMLIRNENTKIYRRPRTWIIIAFLVSIIALMAGIMKWDEVKYPPSANWQEEIVAHNAELTKMIAEQGQSESNQMIEEWERQIILNDYYLSEQINPNKISLWSYMDTASLLIVLISILTVIIAADMIAAEFSWGTIKLLLVGPATRSKILTAKYIATLQFALLLLVTSFVVSFGAGAILSGLDTWNVAEVTVNAANQIEVKSMLISILQKYGFGIVELVMYVTMAFMISAAFRSSTMAISFSLIAIFMGNMIVSMLAKYAWVKYILFANINLSQYMTNTPLRPDMSLSFSIIVLAVYYIVFQLITWIMFTKRDVAG
ncbi:ABC transporter permease [Paenibacillus yanchengensis]|uniref:ABC transporter permease n=1 Tax=Paenibacillus yanchengensis TaxID=2035833 RepID=A0ABW4YQ31_9BACL